MKCEVLEAIQLTGRETAMLLSAYIDKLSTYTHELERKSREKPDGEPEQLALTVNIFGLLASIAVLGDVVRVEADAGRTNGQQDMMGGLRGKA